MSTFLRTALGAAILATLAACGGGGGESSGGAPVPQTATVGIALTDAPAPDVDQALATITSIDLLGEAGPVSLYSGLVTVDLLRLTDYSELFAVRDDVPAGSYSKIRLQLSRLELVRLDDSGAVAETIVPRLVGNGKIDLNPQGPFFVAPGATLVITLDFDVGKSLKITQTGNGRLIVRPVVFVDIANGLPSPGLTRLHGRVADLTAEGNFRLCQTRLASATVGDDDEDGFGDDRRCVRVRTDGATGIFAPDGLPQEFGALAEGERVTAIGRLRPVVRDDDQPLAERFDLEAYVLEEGPLGTFRRLRGRVDQPVDPGTDRFGLAVAPGQGIVSAGPLAAQLFPGSRIFSPRGVELGRLDLTTGTAVLADSVLAVAGGSDDVLRTALVVVDVDGVDAEQVVSGELVAVDPVAGQLIVADAGGDRCVDARGADVFLLADDDDGLDTGRGTLADLTPGQSVNVFGRDGPTGCLVAETILAGR